MDRYIGADAHQASVTFCVLDARGKVVGQDVVETRGRPLVDYLKGISGRLHLCLEEGEWCNWLHEILSGHVAEVAVYRPQWRPGPKSDAIDAHGLAEKLRTGRIDRPVYKGKAFRELREAARIYTKITRDVARVKNRIRSVYRSRGLGPEVFDPRKRERVEKLLPGFLRGPIELLGAELEGLEELKTRAEERMLTASHRHRITGVLESAPGMGPVRVAQMIPIVMTPYRFRTKRQFWSYCGFGIVTRSSSDWVHQNGQGSGDDGDCALRTEPASGGLRSAIGQRDEAEPGEANDRPKGLGDGSGDVEDGGSIRSRATEGSDNTVTRRKKPSWSSSGVRRKRLGKKVEGKHPFHAVILMEERSVN